MKIIGVAGKKQSGKTTTAKIIHGIILKENSLIEDFNIDEHGKLQIKTRNSNGEFGWGEFDIERKDEGFIKYAHYNMWPFVKIYNFADELKNMCNKLFDIPLKCLYGTNEEKNKIQKHLLWENMPGVVTDSETDVFFEVQEASLNPHGYPLEYSKLTHHKPGPMTAREFMQFLGTDTMRKMYDEIWTSSTLKKIKQEQSECAIIADVRFPNEVEAIKKAGGIVIKLCRTIADQEFHSSETALDVGSYNQSNFDFIIENENYEIVELTEEITKIYREIT